MTRLSDLSEQERNQLLAPYKSHIKALRERVRRLEEERHKFARQLLGSVDAKMSMDYDARFREWRGRVSFPELRYEFIMDRPLHEMRDREGFIHHLLQSLAREMGPQLQAVFLKEIRKLVHL